MADLLRQRQQAEQASPSDLTEDLPPPPLPAEEPHFIAPRSQNYTDVPQFAPPHLPPPPPPPQAFGSGLNPLAAPPPPIAGSHLDESAPPKVQDILTQQAVLAGLVAGFVGAAVWAILILIMEFEFSILAIAVGYGIGYAASYHGGRGLRMGLVCAVIAFFSLTGGRFLGVRLGLESFVRQYAESAADPLGLLQDYGRDMAAAQEYAAVESGEVDVRSFMLAYEFTKHSNAGDITEADVAQFHAEDGVRLMEVAATMPTSAEHLRKWGRQKIDQYIAEVSTPSARIMLFFSLFGLIDLSMFVFGIGAAFYVGCKKDGDS